MGSSSINRSGSIKRAAARLTRIRHPPDRAEVGPFCISLLNCNPERIVAALVFALSAPIIANLAYTSSNRLRSAANLSSEGRLIFNFSSLSDKLTFVSSAGASLSNLARIFRCIYKVKII